MSKCLSENNIKGINQKKKMFSYELIYLRNIKKNECIMCVYFELRKYSVCIIYL